MSPFHCSFFVFLMRTCFCVRVRSYVCVRDEEKEGEALVCPVMCAA